MIAQPLPDGDFEQRELIRLIKQSVDDLAALMSRVRNNNSVLTEFTINWNENVRLYVATSKFLKVIG